MLKILEGFQEPVALDFNWSIDRDSYFADKTRLNFHSLLDFKRDPKAYREGFFDLREETDAMKFGTALHALLLQGEKVYKDEVAAFVPPVNPKTGEPYGPTTNATKEARAAFESANKGKTIITAAEAELIERLNNEFNFHPLAPSVLGRADWAKSEIPVCGSIPLKEGRSIAVKGMVDRYSEAGLIDLKTTAQIDDGSGRDRFRYAIYDYKYLIQLGFYHLILTECYGAPFVPCWIIAVEKNAPNRVAVYAIAADVVQKARDVARSWLEDFDYSSSNDVYESPYDSLQIITQYSADRDL